MSKQNDRGSVRERTMEAIRRVLGYVPRGRVPTAMLDYREAENGARSAFELLAKIRESLIQDDEGEYTEVWGSIVKEIDSVLS